MRYVVLLVAGTLLFTSACSVTPGAVFTGKRDQKLVSADQVGQAASLPNGYRNLGNVRASCTQYRGQHPPHDARLSDVDCNRERLAAALRERAAEVGGTLLIGRRCSLGVPLPKGEADQQRLRCEAGVARPQDHSLAGRQLAYSHHEPKTDSVSVDWLIDIRFSPTDIRRPGERPDQIREVPERPLGHVELGDVAAQCDEDCSLAAVRRGVLIAAARYGAKSVSKLACVREQKGWLCTGRASTHQFDPRHVPAAR